MQEISYWDERISFGTNHVQNKVEMQITEEARVEARHASAHALYGEILI